MAIFISHASADDGFVARLRTQLEAHGRPVWVDSRNLRGGDKLKPEIEKAIRSAEHCLVVLSPKTINSGWVKQEIEIAERRVKKRFWQFWRSHHYRVIPLLLDGIEPSALALWFEEEPVGVKVTLASSGLDEAFPEILTALGVQLPDDHQPMIPAEEKPIADLLLKLSRTSVTLKEGKQRLKAEAELIYYPPDYPTTRETQGYPFHFTAPLGPIEAEDLRWYLERYYIWPVGLFKERAEAIEARLPQWGQALFQATLALKEAQAPLTAWQQAKGNARRFSVVIDERKPRSKHTKPETLEKAQEKAQEAATLLMALPWELLHQPKSGYLFQGAEPAAIRRRLPNRKDHGPIRAELPIRILLVSPRPEDATTGYIDHRLAAQALVQSIGDLGSLARLTLLDPPTYPALGQALKAARERGEPFDVVHFDGHGVFDEKHGLGALCFEAPNQEDQLEKRKVELIYADQLAATLADHRIPLVFLEACQSAQSDTAPTASVAAKLLEQGCSAVLAMGYSVLVETARRFTEAFYGRLAAGHRVGEALLAGQVALHDDPERIPIPGAGRLRLSDWFVPVLYQEVNDPLLFTQLPPAELRRLQAQRHQLSLGALPEPPPQEFIGRSRELLAAERLLARQPYVVIRGTGGAGKTTLATELARWLVATHRFQRAGFVSLEEYSDPRSLLDTLGRQLVADWTSVAEIGDLDRARQFIDRALRDRATLLVIDNCESILEVEWAGDETQNPAATAIFALCQQLLAAADTTRLIFTSRERLPAPFDTRTLALGPLSPSDAIDLVAKVMKNEGLEPKADDPGGTPKEIQDLVDAAGRHARALVLLAREVAQRGVQATTEALTAIMADLDKRHPGDRENSLYASLALSLNRLPPEIREQVWVLAAFRGGAHLFVINPLLGTAIDDVETWRRFAAALIAVGLGQDRGNAHLALDPALPAYLAREVPDPPALEARWAQAVAGLLGYLYQQLGQDAQEAADLTRLELANLLKLLEWGEAQGDPSQVIDWANRVERLVANLGLPAALAKAEAIRSRTAEKLAGQPWSHAAYLHESSAIERLQERGDLNGAFQKAQKLLEECLAAGDAAYEGAVYDTAMAHFGLGRILEMGGRADAALGLLQQAQGRFEALGASGEGMASTCLTEQGTCLRHLGRLDEAAAKVEEAMGRDEKAGRARDVAVGKGQLATVRMFQKRYQEALEAYAEARQTFETLGEPGGVATAWHQIGNVYERTGNHDQAEQAYRQSLAIETRRGNRAGEASTLTQLGNLYNNLGRPEEAVNAYRQAADIDVELKDLRSEGRERSNLARTLIQLNRLNEARQALQRAIECDQPFGHVAEPWKTWDILHHLEQAAGHPQAAASARQKAIAAYLAYRRDGGEPQATGGQLAEATAQAIAQGQTTQLLQQLKQFNAQATTQADLSAEDRAYYLQTLIPKLQAILQGARDPALPQDPNLYYADAAELTLLLDRLAQ